MDEQFFDELVKGQRARLMAIGSQIIPNITEDDLLQPNDFEALENCPYFRYEEGVLEGILTVRAAFLARLAEQGIN